MKKFKVIVSNDEFKKAWNLASKHNHIYAIYDMVSMILSIIMFTYKYYYYALAFAIISFILHWIFFNKVQKELIEQGILEEVTI